MFSCTFFHPLFLLFGIASSAVSFLVVVVIMFKSSWTPQSCKFHYFFRHFCLLYLFFILVSYSVYLACLCEFVFSESLLKVRIFVDVWISITASAEYKMAYSFCSPLTNNFNPFSSFFCIRQAGEIFKHFTNSNGI